MGTPLVSLAVRKIWKFWKELDGKHHFVEPDNGAYDYGGDVECAVFASHLSAIVNKNHPLARQSSTILRDMMKYDIALPICGFQVRNAFDGLISNRDRKLRHV